MIKKMSKTMRFTLGVVFGLVLLSGVVVFGSNSGAFAFGNARPQVVIVLDGALKRDNEKISLNKIEAVAPGEIIQWTIASENKGEGDAQNFMAVGKIPAGTVFVEDSAKPQGDALVTYSIDGGKNFSQQPMVEEKQLDGSVKMVAAPVSMYSQVRFEWKAPLVAKEQLNATYEVRVK